MDEQKLTPWIAKHPEQMVKLDSPEDWPNHPAYGPDYTGGKYDEDIRGKSDWQRYSFLGLALLGANSEVIGVLKVENKLKRKEPKEYTAFDNDDVQLLKFISNIIVLAITKT